MNFFKKIPIKKNDWLTIAVMAICLGLFMFFPTANAFQQVTSNFIFFCVAPFLYIKLILDKNPREFGVNLKNRKDGAVWGVSMLIVACLLSFFIVKFTNFIKNSDIPGGAMESFWIFLFYQLILFNGIFFFQEFFFKSFILFYFSRIIGFYSVPLSVIIYTGFIFSGGDFSWQAAPMISWAFLGGIVAYMSRSFIYSYLAGTVYFLLFNAYIIHILNK
jgi:hypothetical protein